jgi:ribose transport system ATP-binding protein
MAPSKEAEPAPQPARQPVVQEEPPPALRVDSVTKQFGELRALDTVSLDAVPGQVHALLGANGSGKSTLVKIMSGALAPDSGELWLDGQRLASLGSPAVATARGIRVVHQEAPLIDNLTVLESVALWRGYHARSLGPIGWRSLRRSVAALLDRMDVPVSPGELCSQVGAADRAGIALAIAVGDLGNGPGAREPGGGASGTETGAEARARLLIVDEVTAAIPEADAARHLSRLRRLADGGLAIVMVTHRLAELEIADDITVLRAGQVVYRQGESARLPDREIVQQMVGPARAGSPAAPGGGLADGTGDGRRHPVQALRAAIRETPGQRRRAATSAGHSGSGDIVRFHDVTGRELRGLTMSAAAGEVVGFAGLPQSGIAEIPKILSGGAPRLGGTLEIAGQPIRTRATPADLLAAGVTTIPADRLREGGVASLSLSDNVVLPALSAYWHRSALRKKLVSGVISALDVRPTDPRILFGALSGGNQQKVLLGKWLSLRPDVLVLDDPTYGVDPAAREIIFDAITDAAGLGTCVLFFSTEPEQLVRVCTRILTIQDGMLARTLSGPEITLENVANWSYQ